MTADAADAAEAPRIVAAAPMTPRKILFIAHVHRYLYAEMDTCHMWDNRIKLTLNVRLIVRNFARAAFGYRSAASGPSLRAAAAKIDGAAKEALELPSIRFAGQSEGDLHRLEVASGHLPQTFDHTGDYEFRVLPSEMPGNADELDLNRHPFPRPNELWTHRLVDDAAIARRERQGIADVFGSGGDIEQQPGFAWVRFLGEVQSKLAVPQRLRRVLKNLALRHSRDATLTVVNVALRYARVAQKRCDGDVVRTKEGDGLPSGEPRRAWQDCPTRVPGHVRRSECERLCDCAVDLTAMGRGRGQRRAKLEGIRSHDPVIGYRFAGQPN